MNQLVIMLDRSTKQHPTSIGTSRVCRARVRWSNIISKLPYPRFVIASSGLFESSAGFWTLDERGCDAIKPRESDRVSPCTSGWHPGTLTDALATAERKQVKILTPPCWPGRCTDRRCSLPSGASGQAAGCRLDRGKRRCTGSCTTRRYRG